jgi:hypothetical protein
MNFKTTLVLLVALAALGAFIFVSNSKTETKKTDTEVAANERRLFDAKAEDVTKITVVGSDGKRTVVERSNGNWKLVEPVSAPAEAFEVDALARALVELKSHGSVTDSGSASATGLATPQYKVEFTTKDNKTQTLNVGNKSAVGDNLYVSTGGSQAEVVNTALLDQLEKPANSYRNPKLVNLANSDVKQLTIKRADGTISLEKIGSDWRMNEPKKFAADASEVDDVVMAITGLRATDWVDVANAADAKQYQLDNPRVTVTLSATTKPTTQSATTAGAATQPVVIKIGRYDDVLRKNVLATSSEANSIAKVAASVVDTLNKKPIEFRDKRVLQIASADVSGIVVLADLPATTQPATKPASKKELILQRHQSTLPVGVAAPSTKSSTKPTTVATTTTAPAATQAAATKPANKWDLLTAAGATEVAEDSKVDELLFQLNPLRAEKYLESAPATTQPAPTYTLKITSQGPGGAPPEQQTVTITDPGPGKAPIATYNDLSFEVSRTLLEKLDADYKKGAASSAAPKPPTPGFPDAP